MVAHHLRPRPTDACTAVIEAVASAEGVDPEALEPRLHDVIDPDSLNALFAGRESENGQIKFAFHGYLVAVDGRGTVRLDPSG